MNVVSGARKATEAIASLVFASSQEDTVKGAKEAEDAIKVILANISARAPNVNVQKQLLDAAQNTSRAMLDLLMAVRGDRDDPRVKMQVSTKADDLTSLLNDLVGVCNKYPEASNASLVEENLELKAEQQLLAAAEMIRKAAQELAFAPVIDSSKKKGLDSVVGLQIDEAQIASELIESTREVVKAGSELMEAAVRAQSDRKMHNQNNSKYRNDPTWANGLISSSKNVASCMMMLVRACNQSIRGDIEDEAIIALASQVASGTAQLVTASRVKADLQSNSQRNLDLSAKTVAKTTDNLVKRVNHFSEAIENSQNILPSGTNLKAKLEQQMAILRLEKELESARRQMGKINREDYKS